MSKTTSTGKAAPSLRIGIWFGFPFEIQTKREGIGRYTVSLAKALMENFNSEVELWCYEINKSNFESLFEPIIKDKSISHLLRIHTEASSLNQCQLDIETSWLRDFIRSKDVIHRDQLLEVCCNTLSKADCFLVPIVSLTNAINLIHPVVIALHDLVTVEFKHLFAEEEGYDEQSTKSVLLFAQQIAADGAFFCSNSNYVRNNHALKYIDGLRSERTDYIHLPVIPPPIHQDVELPSKEVLEYKYGLPKRYFFYPTQIRPYKNLEALIRLLDRIRFSDPDLKLVITGKPNKRASALSKILALDDQIVLTGDVSEIELYALHKYAEFSIAPSYFEGGIPWQALEAIQMETPALIARTPGAIERLESIGIDPSDCTDFVFDPDNIDQLTGLYRNLQANRTTIIEQQQRIQKLLAQYTWSDVANRYYNIFSTRTITRKRSVAAFLEANSAIKASLQQKPPLTDTRIQPQNKYVAALKKLPIVSPILLYTWRLLKAPQTLASIWQMSMETKNSVADLKILLTNQRTAANKNSEINKS